MSHRHTEEQHESNKGLYYPVSLSSTSPTEYPFDIDADASQPVAGPESQRTAKSAIQAAVKTALRTLVVGFAIYGLLHVIFRDDNHEESRETEAVRRTCNCGHSIEEAKRLGCEYDPIAVAWLPPHCRDDALSEEFASLADWKYTEIHNKSRTMDGASVAGLSKGSFFSTSLHWHLTHCAYVWMKQQRARHGGVVQLEKRFDNEEHVRHCLEVFLDRKPLNAKHLGFGVVTMADGELDTPMDHD
jgi:hypothetical protein